jgi:hypothetical protein
MEVVPTFDVFRSVLAIDEPDHHGIGHLDAPFLSTPEGAFRKGGDARRLPLFQGWELGRKQKVEGPYRLIGRAERNAPACAMGSDESIERVSRPGELHGSPDQWDERDLVDDEPGVFRERVGKLRILELDPSDLRQKLDFQQGDRGDSPMAVFLDPGEGCQTISSCNDPDHKVGVEQNLHGSNLTDRGISPSGEPSHSQLH